MHSAARTLRVGLALGAGATHGWAHIGILRVLGEAGIIPDVVCGTSAGALVGAFHVAGDLDYLEDWVDTMTVERTLQYVRVRQGRSLFGGDLLRVLAERMRGVNIEDLPTPFAAVATDLSTGGEIRIQHGPVARAVAASGAFPVLMPPVRIQDRWAIDGCLVNSVPISVCRDLGADVVIAVRLMFGGEREKLVSEARAEARQMSELLESRGLVPQDGFLASVESAVMKFGRPRGRRRWAALTDPILRRMPRRDRLRPTSPDVFSPVLRAAIAEELITETDPAECFEVVPSGGAKRSSVLLRLRSIVGPVAGRFIRVTASRVGSGRWALTTVVLLRRLLRRSGLRRHLPSAASLGLRLLASLLRRRRQRRRGTTAHADVLITPALGRLTLGADEARQTIELGRQAALEQLPEILNVLRRAAVASRHGGATAQARR